MWVGRVARSVIEAGLVDLVFGFGMRLDPLVGLEAVLERILLPFALVKVGDRARLVSPALPGLLCTGLRRPSAVVDVELPCISVVPCMITSPEEAGGGLGLGARICSINSGGGRSDSAEREASSTDV